MKKKLNPELNIHPGEILKKEFLEELNISARTLCLETGIPESNLSQILKGKRDVTAHISLLLGKFFGLNDVFFLTIQNHYDITKEKMIHDVRLSKIRPYYKLVRFFGSDKKASVAARKRT